jgi:BolA protein
MSHNNLVTSIKEKLTAALNPTHLEIIDESQKHAGHIGAKKGGHFAITIVSPQFVNQSLIQRHRMVYEAVNELMKTSIHALSIQAQTPEEFSK